MIVIEDDEYSADLEYLGFWPRLTAAMIDASLMLLVMVPLTVAFYGWAYYDRPRPVQGWPDFLINWAGPVAFWLLFWRLYQATPGKMAVSARIVDARSGRPMSLLQMIVRYAAYFVSGVPLMLGFLWIALDERGQGWHDKIAGTVVVRARRGRAAARVPPTLRLPLRS